MTTKRIILIPYWVKDVLQRNKMPLADCLDVAKIKPVLSLNDLLSFVASQKFFNQLFGAHLIHDQLYGVWHEGAEGNAELRKFINEMLGLASDPTYNRDVQSRLFEEDARTDQYENPFITYDLSPETLGVVIYPGFFVNQGDIELQKSLVKAILKVLYVYEPSHEVAKTPLFKRYLELLSVK